MRIRGFSVNASAHLVNQADLDHQDRKETAVIEAGTVHQDHQLHRHLLEPPEKEERRDSLESMVCRENPASRGSYTQPMDHQERRENLVHEGRPARKEGPVETERTDWQDHEANAGFLASRARKDPEVLQGLLGRPDLRAEHGHVKAARLLASLRDTTLCPKAA